MGLVDKNRTIAKNAIYLYIRLLVSLLLNLYISRLLLEVLGVDDFGTYNIVGGIVFLMLFVNSTMQNASLRFINVSLGGGNAIEIKQTISSSLQIHIVISLLFLLLGETIGLWYVCNELIIPEKSYDTVLILYQLSLVTALLSILQVPLVSTIMSYEKMNVYASIEIFNVVQRCCIIFLIPLFPNQLLMYGVFLLLIGFVVFLLYFFYCKRHFHYFCLERSFQKRKLSEMLSFAMYNLVGDGTFAIRQQGTNLLINKFFGVGLNAASGVATQAASLISTFISNTQSAFKPQIIKEYSARNVGRMKELMLRETEIMFILLSYIFNIVYINIEFLMKLWLKNVPTYATDFCRVILVCNSLIVFLQILATAIHASGKVKVFNGVIGALNVFCLLLVYLFFIQGFDPVFAYYSYVIVILLKILSEAYILRKAIPSFSWIFLLNMIMKPGALFLLSFLVTYTIAVNIADVFVKLFVSVAINIFVVSIISLVFFPYIKNVVVKYYRR